MGAPSMGAICLGNLWIVMGDCRADQHRATRFLAVRGNLDLQAATSPRENIHRRSNDRRDFIFRDDWALDGSRLPRVSQIYSDSRQLWGRIPPWQLADRAGRLAVLFASQSEFCGIQSLSRNGRAGVREKQASAGLAVRAR